MRGIPKPNAIFATCKKCLLYSWSAYKLDGIPHSHEPFNQPSGRGDRQVLSSKVVSAQSLGCHAADRQSVKPH